MNIIGINRVYNLSNAEGIKWTQKYAATMLGSTLQVRVGYDWNLDESFRIIRAWRHHSFVPKFCYNIGTILGNIRTDLRSKQTISLCFK